MARWALTDRQWAVLEPLLPPGKKAGRPRTWTRRQLIEGIRRGTRTGTPWRDIPERYGPMGPDPRPVPPVAARRHLEADPGATPDKRDPQREPPGGIDTEPDDHRLGRSRGGPATKIHRHDRRGQAGARKFGARRARPCARRRRGAVVEPSGAAMLSLVHATHCGPYQGELALHT
ncbi:transposase [Streptomyces sp. 840.1]|uniref:transposase n=1 Tax=Streptomyces sp. 840.1 TaxID=2485152 RepID=UPI00288ADD13|nr:transposase [Streptomyces sp. 840.1]